MIAPHIKRRLDQLHAANGEEQRHEPGQEQTNTDPAPKKVWTSVITNTKYLPGLLTLDYSLKKAGTKYPLIALYTENFPREGRAALEARGISCKEIPYLLPSTSKDFGNDPRFYECWSKLATFGLTEYDTIILLDSDMLVLKNMDELMDIELDSPDLGGSGTRVFAASHACACNPLKKAHYPKDWIPENCAFTSQHEHPDDAQKVGASSAIGVASLNSGLCVICPSQGAFDSIAETLKNGDLTANYEFADQSLLGELFDGRWVALPYIYNALKTLRWKGVHDAIWRDDQVKNIHYILSPKPWDETRDKVADETHLWWFDVNDERLQDEKSRGIDDGF